MCRENEELKQAINFLLFSYFGITLDDNDETIIKAAVDRAYRDASSHVLSIKDDIKNSKDENVNPKIKAKNEIIKFIKAEEPYIDSNAYNDNHKMICEKIYNIYNNGKEIYKKDKKGGYRKFTYGISQKWINMTVKNLCIIKSVFSKFKEDFDAKSFLENLFTYLSDFHVPVDSIIIKAAREEKVCKNIPKKAWSQWNGDDYKNFQKDIHENYKISEKIKAESPHEWEAKVWIEYAKKEKGEEENDKIN